MLGAALAIRPSATRDAEPVRRKSMMARPVVFIMSPKYDTA
jgi:hypothetical protein